MWTVTKDKTELARVEGGIWSGELARLGAALEPFGGMPKYLPDPDKRRAEALAKAVGGKVSGEAIPPRPGGVLW